MDQIIDSVFKRTALGDQEIRDRTLQLTKIEQTILVAVDGEATVRHLSKRFLEEEQFAFKVALTSLREKGLIELRRDELMSINTGTSFFSSTMQGPESASSGVSVDTRSKSVKRMDEEEGVGVQLAEVDLPLPLELPENAPIAGKDNRGRPRLNKLVQVFPEPAPVKSKRSKKKRQKPASVPTWLTRLYLGLIALGLLMIVLAVMSGAK